MKGEFSLMKSIWIKDSESVSYPALSTNIEVDVAIVGGGITGITAAYLLAEQGKRVVVLEAEKIGKGSTGYSTGNLYSTVGERLANIQSKHSKDAMLSVVNSRSAAINFIEQKTLEHQIECNFKRVPWHLFCTDPSDKLMDEVGKEFDAAREANLEATNELPMVFPINGVKKITTLAHQAQFNPYTYIVGLARAITSPNCTIYENTKVTNVKDGSPCTIETEGGLTITAEKVIMATHSPKGIYQVHTEMEVYREFALAVKVRGEIPPEGIYWHTVGEQQYSLRPYSNEEGNFLIVIGDPYLVGSKENTAECIMKIEEYLSTHFDLERIVYSWAAQNYKSADGLPYIGTSPLQTNTYIATGFKADGLVYGTLAAILISDEIMGLKNEWMKLYNPTRFTPLASAKQFAKENANVISHLVKDYLFYGEVDELKQIKAGEGKTLTVNDEKIAAYRDMNNKLHVVSSVCTHMGCIVHFNNMEKSWDCPCHGSRFTVDGEVIEGPAYTDLPKPKNDPSSL